MDTNKRNHWKGYPDYWMDFEFREVIETIWDNYADEIDEIRGLIRQIDRSKSIISLPYTLQKTWLHLAFYEGKTTTIEGPDRLIRIDQLVDNKYKPVEIPFTIDPETNTVTLEPEKESDLYPYIETDEGGKDYISLWAPVYHVHNPAVTNFFSPLLGLDTLEREFDRQYGIKNWSHRFYRVVKGLWYIFVSGPTIENLEIGLSIVFNVPVALRPGTVIKKDTVGLQTTLEVLPDGEADATDEIDRWVFVSNLNCPLNVGDRVEAMQILVEDAIHVLDYINSPGWWNEYAEAGEREKLELIEKYSTTLFQLDAESYFRDYNLSEGESGDTVPALFAEFVNKVLPTFIKFFVAYTSSWREEVEMPGEDLDVHAGIEWIESAFNTELDKVTPLKDIEEGVNTYAKHDGVLPYQERPLVHGFSDAFVVHSKHRLFIPRDSHVEDVTVADGTPINVLARGLFWIDTDYRGTESPVKVTFREIDYEAAGGYAPWEDEIHMISGVYTKQGPLVDGDHQLDDGFVIDDEQMTVDDFFGMFFGVGEDSREVYAIDGKGINCITYIKAPSNQFGVEDALLEEGKDYRIIYRRKNVGEGQLFVELLGEPRPYIKVGVLRMPWVPVSEGGINTALKDELQVKLIVHDPNTVDYDNGRWFFEGEEVFIGGDGYAKYDGKFYYNGEIRYDGGGYHFYRMIAV